MPLPLPSTPEVRRWWCRIRRYRSPIICRRAGSSSSPALLEVLSVIREAWPEPRSLFDTRCTVTRMSYSCQKEASEDVARADRAVAPLPGGVAARAQPRGLPPPRPGASPGLLRRRYSVPETIMRKYRLAQQRSDSEETGPATSASPASGSPARGSCSSLCEAAQTARGARREREQMRRSALLRRLWGRSGTEAACCCESVVTRSLGSSHAELRPLTSPCSSRHSHAPGAGWATPKRQRLDSSRDFRGSDEMIRAAMRNSYDRTEEARSDRLHRTELSESTYPDRDASNLDAMTDCDTPFDVRCERNGFAQYSDRNSSDTAPAEAKIDFSNDCLKCEFSASNASKDEYSYTDSSDPFSASTAKETNGSVLCNLAKTSRSAHIDGRISERSVSVENDENNLLPYDVPLTVDTPSYELLEIVVSETSNANNVTAVKSSPPEHSVTRSLKAPKASQRNAQNINIDEYVSNILVESLNSLTDQLECMNASIGNDRKINIVEKEIKVKLQNTGVNTIVHLSPTSNNQIIFGNEELCNNDGRKDKCNNPQDGHEVVGIRDEIASMESINNNEGTESACRAHDAVNKAVLQQIQKLFQDELNNLDTETLYPPGQSPGISHIEISNVDVYIDNNSENAFGNNEIIEMHTQNTTDLAELISSIGAGNYYENPENGAVVPRFSAFPHTESMEVNTSSSDDAEIGGSDCTSLVDSLDDPNSPRSLLLRRSFNANTRRSELVRSAIDVLDLLPEDALKGTDDAHKEKGEAFFIRIKDDDCDCEKENVVVADHMPEKIKQRLYRRHRRRELRMECARRARPPPPRRSTARPDRDCRALLDALIDEVIVKIAHDEYKYLRIKQKASRMVVSKSDENVSQRCSKREAEHNKKKEAFKMTRNRSIDAIKDRLPETKKSERRHVRGKMSLLTQPLLAPDERGPKRIYQKSEIHEGNKCIEILEILEYVTGSQSSSETTNSDENYIHSCKGKKSKIPIPVNEKIPRTTKGVSQRNHHSEKVSSPPASHTENKNSISRLTTSPTELSPENEPSRRPPETRSRSNSLRFRRVFDSIPEERSSLSIESSNEDVNHNRRASAPNVIENYRSDVNGNGRRGSIDVLRCEIPKKKDSAGGSTETRSTGTSPLAPGEEEPRAQRLRSQTTMTSPLQRSAATSPLPPRSPARAPPAPRAAPRPAPRPAPRAPSGPKTTEVDSDAGVVRPEREIRRDARTNSNLGGTEAMLRADRPKCDVNTKRNGEPKRTREHARSESRHRKAAESSRGLSMERSEPEVTVRKRSVKLPQFKCVEAVGAAGGCRGACSSDSSDSGGSLLCSLAPRWLAHAHRSRRPRRREPPLAPAPAPDPSRDTSAPHTNVTGGWSVTVAGSCRAALPADLEMRLRFPNDRAGAGRDKRSPHQHTRSHRDHRDHSSDQECWCGICRRACHCGCGPASPPRAGRTPRTPHTPHPARAPLDAPDPAPPAGKLTLTMKKEATDSSILASKSVKKSADPLPDLETYKASRSKTKSSVKARRGYSLHCWLPDDERVPLRTNNGLSVLGCAIIPELKPRVPTMSERDLTRAFTPRHYLRS
ncbi:hypothetical protein evm_011879 [Chilo suppressalis]|nr:hypothetical protein evm_011879 [Chilo suppressalis]